MKRYRKNLADGEEVKLNIHLKRPVEIERMRAAGIVVAKVLAALGEACEPGTTTAELDTLAAETITQAGGKASFLGYQVKERVFPASVCISLNEEVVHGIPGPRKLASGDIVGLDVGVLLDGFHADSATTVAVGEISPEAARLLEVTEASLWAGIQAAQAGRRVGSIASAVQRYAESRGFSVVKTLVGHGVGRSLHEDPPVPNYGEVNSGPRLTPGMTLAIEPMVNVGCEDVEHTLWDHWTLVTKDGSLSAHFEHTVAITRNGPDVLTIAPGSAWGPERSKTRATGAIKV